MVKDRRVKNNVLKNIFFSILYFIGVTLIISSHAGELLSLKVVYRVIYIPLAFWLLTAIYAYLFRFMGGEKINIPVILMLGMPVHLILLLLNTYFSVVHGAPDIGFFYNVYIEVVLYVLVFLSLYYGIRLIEKSLFFTPLIYISLYAIYLSFACRDIRTFCAFTLIILINFLIKPNRNPLGSFGVFLRKIIDSKIKILLIIFILAFLARMLFGLNVINQTKELFPTASDDGTTYDMHGWEMAKDPAHVRSTEFLPTPWDTGYTFILGFIYKIFGRSFYMAVFIQSVIGAFVPVLAYLLSEIIIKRRLVAILSAIWCSLDQPLIMLSSVLGQESFYIPILTCLIFVVTLYSLEKKKNMVLLYDILIGILLGVANVVRSAILAFAPLLMTYIFFIKKKKNILKRMADIILILFIMALIISPITYLNYLNSGKFFLLTQPKPITDWLSDEGAGYFFPSNMPLAKMGVDPFRDVRLSIVNITKNPLKFLSILADLLSRRSIGFFFCHNFGFFDPIYMVNAAKIPNSFASNLEFYLALLVLAGFFLVIKNKENRKKAWPMLLILLYYLLLHVVILRLGSNRYRVPLHPYLIIFGAVAISSLLHYIKKGLNSYNEDTVNKS